MSSQIAPHPGISRVLDLPTGEVAILDVARASDAPARGDALLVPGYTGSKEDYAPILAGLAAAGFRVVAMDLPGQHESPGPVDRGAYAVEVLGQVVLAVADRISDHPVHLLGHSFGGLVCRSTAIEAPHRLASLVLLNSGPAGITGNRADRMRLLEPVLAAGGMPAVYDAMDQLERLDPRHASRHPELEDFLRRRFLASSAECLRGMGEALQAEPDRVAELRASGLPIMVAYGAADESWQPATQADMAVRLGARHEVIDGAAHSPAIEQPERTIALLTDFWRRRK